MTAPKKETNKETGIQLPTGVTIEAVNSWKERYGQNKIKLATISDADESFEMDIIVRVPDRKTMSQFEKYLDNNPDKAKDLLVKACVLSAKEEVLANEDKFMAAFNAVAEILPVQKAIIKNL